MNKTYFKKLNKTIISSNWCSTKFEKSIEKNPIMIYYYKVMR